jgi:hypothetical protein
MPRPMHYYPVISRFLVSVLYHEAKRRGTKMTKLTDTLLTESLKDTEGWKEAATARVQETPPPYAPKKAA